MGLHTHDRGGNALSRLWWIAPAMIVAMGSWSLAKPDEPMRVDTGVTVIKAPTEKGWARVASPMSAPVQAAVSAPPASTPVGLDEQPIMPPDLAAIESEGSSEPPLGEGGTALGQP